jgi:hypothetical protein
MELSMKKLLGTVGVLFLAHVGSAAAATDWKAFSATGCQPYGASTTLADLAYSGYGVTNKSTTTPKAVVCPLVSDTEGVVGPTNTITAWIGFSAGAASGNVFCALYVGTRGSGLVSGTVNTAWIAPGTTSEGGYSITLNTLPAAPGSYPALPAVAVCTLAPRTGLNAIWLQEGATNTP